MTKRSSVFILSTILIILYLFFYFKRTTSYPVSDGGRANSSRLILTRTKLEGYLFKPLTFIEGKSARYLDINLKRENSGKISFRHGTSR